MPCVHNYALKIPWAQVGRGAQLRHAPKRGLNRTRGFPFGYFSFSFRTSISGNTVRQLYCRTHDTTAKEADNYVIQRNSQVDYRFHIIRQLALGRDIVLLFCSLHYLYHSALMQFFNKQCMTLRLLLHSWYMCVCVCSLMTPCNRTPWCHYKKYVNL